MIQAPNVVTVLVEAARNLRPPGSKSKGLCDPLVVVRCGGNAKQCKALRKTNNPKWHFQAQIGNVDPQELLLIEVRVFSPPPSPIAPNGEWGKWFAWGMCRVDHVMDKVVDVLLFLRGILDGSHQSLQSAARSNFGRQSAAKCVEDNHLEYIPPFFGPPEYTTH